MKLDLSEIANTPGMRATYPFEEAPIEDSDVSCIGVVRVELRLANTGSLLLVECDMSVVVNMECSRCLRSFEFPVEGHIQEELRIVKIGDSVRVLPLEEEESYSDIVNNNVLDVGELARQELLLALPIQPLCKEGCKGLCPVCGQNLNLGNCSCGVPGAESPFHILADLLDYEESDF